MFTSLLFGDAFLHWTGFDVVTNILKKKHRNKYTEVDKWNKNWLFLYQTDYKQTDWY